MNVLRYVPPYNLIYCWLDGNFDKRRRINKIAHTAYGVVGGLALGVAIIYGSWINTSKFIEWNIKETIAYKNELRNELFGEGGLADRNNNGRPDLTEVAEVYERIGLGEKVLETEKFPPLSIEYLERAVEIYKSQE